MRADDLVETQPFNPKTYAKDVRLRRAREEEKRREVNRIKRRLFSKPKPVPVRDLPLLKRKLLRSQWMMMVNLAASYQAFHSKHPVPHASCGCPKCEAFRQQLRDAHLYTEEMRENSNRIYLAQVMKFVCERHGVTEIDICGGLRKRHVTGPRQEFMRVARLRTGRSLPEIGRFCGDKDHTTVLHGNRMYKEHSERHAKGLPVKFYDPDLLLTDEQIMEIDFSQYPKPDKIERNINHEP